MKISKDICRWCCNVEKTAKFNEFKQDGEVVPWNDEDESRWQEGGVCCPHRRHFLKMEYAIVDCLHGGIQFAYQTGVLAVWDEQSLGMSL